MYGVGRPATRRAPSPRRTGPAAGSAGFSRRAPRTTAPCLRRSCCHSLHCHLLARRQAEMPPLPRLTLMVNFDPGDTDLVVRQFLPPGSRIIATKPSAVAFGSTVMVLAAVFPGATEMVSD